MLGTVARVACGGSLCWATAAPEHADVRHIHTVSNLPHAAVPAGQRRAYEDSVSVLFGHRYCVCYMLPIGLFHIHAVESK